jgi:branched-subunit amino acid transport protein
MTPMLKEFLSFVPVFLAGALIAGLVEGRALSTGLLAGLAIVAFFVYSKIFGASSWQAKVYPGLLIVICIVKFFWHD